MSVAMKMKFSQSIEVPRLNRLNDLLVKFHLEYSSIDRSILVHSISRLRSTMIETSKELRQLVECINLDRLIELYSE